MLYQRENHDGVSSLQRLELLHQKDKYTSVLQRFKDCQSIH